VPEASDANDESPIIVGVDDSDGARAALAYAAGLAAAMGRPLTIVHATGERHGSIGEMLTSAEFIEAVRVSAEETVRELTDEVLGADSAATVAFDIRDGAPAVVLVDASEDAEMLVVGGRGRGGFARLSLGSVSHACVNHAACPVLVVRGRSSEGAAR
jgi:nucleotide-binding universal stress UspA family protein